MKIHEQIKEEKKNFLYKTKELDKTWTDFQKHGWKNDPKVNILKKERKKKLQRLYYLEKKFHILKCQV